MAAWLRGCVAAWLRVVRVVPHIPGLHQHTQGFAELPVRMEFAELPPKPWSETLPAAPEEARDLVSRLMVLDPEKRLSAAEALAHPFLTTGPPAAPVSLAPA